MAEPIPLPSVRSERVIIYCLGCGRSAWTATYIVQAMFGYLPYGFLTGRLHCRKGCGDRFGVVLPLDAPTPRQFVVKYAQPPAPPPKAEQHVTAPEDYLPGALVEIGTGGNFTRIHARAEDPEILHLGFDYLPKKFAENQWAKPPRLAVTRGSQWSRDSARDFKIVGGKVIECEDDSEFDDLEGPEDD